MKAHRKLLAMLLALVLCCTALPLSAFAVTPTYKSWDGTSDVSWYNDTDTEFRLTTAEQLAGLAEIVNGGNTMAGKTIYLDADLDLAGHEWRSIGIGSITAYSSVVRSTAKIITLQTLLPSPAPTDRACSASFLTELWCKT